jgi:hypothetical protein
MAAAQPSGVFSPLPLAWPKILRSHEMQTSAGTLPVGAVSSTEWPGKGS